MRLMYVFDARESEGHLFRAPEWVAKAFCWLYRWEARKNLRLRAEYGYAPTTAGY